MNQEHRKQVKVHEEMDGTRVDVVLSLMLPQTSRNFIQKLIRKGKVSINGNTCLNKKYKTQRGDYIQLIIPEPEEQKAEAENIPLDIHYEDEDLLVVDKPRGMVVHPAAGNSTGTLVNGILHHCGSSLSSINGVIRPGIVHRIDKDTSGLLVIAKNDMAHNKLAEQFASHTIARKYLAIVYRTFKEREGRIDAPIGRNPKNRLKQGVTECNSKPAVTHYEVLEQYKNFALIQAVLETGRTHQIRVHMAHIGHPILGDPLYGPKKKFLKAEGQMLHARLLGFLHPRDDKYMEFQSNPPEEFRRILELIKKL